MTVRTYLDPECHTKPVARERGDVWARGTSKPCRAASKLASDRHPFVVRSVDEQREHERVANERIESIERELAKLAGNTHAEQYRRHVLRTELGSLVVPVFHVLLGSDGHGIALYVSGSVLSDYIRENVAVTVLELPQRRRGLNCPRYVNVKDGYLASLDVETNDASLVARAAKLVSMENDAWAMEIVRYWQFHGSLWKCHGVASECEWCTSNRTVHYEELVEFCHYYGAEIVDNGKHWHTRRALPRHRMPAVSLDDPCWHRSY